MAAPVFIANGSGITITTVDGAVGFPAHQVNDLAILRVKSPNEAVVLTVPSGFTHLGTALGTGTPGAAGSAMLEIYYRFCETSTETSPTVAALASTKQQFAWISIYRGAYIGNPPKIGSRGVGTGTSVSMTGGVTTTANTRVLMTIADGIDVSGGRASAQANASLTGIVENFDNGSNTDIGGGLSSASGTKAVAGSYGTSTATLTSSAGYEWATIILSSLAEASPDVQITSTPVVISTSDDATFVFTVSEGAAEYDLDGAGFASATSPLVFTDLDSGEHVLTIRSVEDNDAEAVFTWSVSSLDSTPPTLEPVSPDPGEQPGSPGAFSANYSTAKVTPIVVRFEDTGEGAGVGFMMVAIKISTDGTGYVLAYAGEGEQAGFLAPFLSYSTITPDGDDFVLSVRHDDDWPKNSLISVKSRAVDLSGNVMT